MHVVIFEGSRWPTCAPLSLSRPVFMLRSGMGTLLEKQLRYLQPTRLTLWVRPGLAEYCRQHVVPNLPCPTAINEPLDTEQALLVSGRTLHMGRYEYPHELAVNLEDDGAVASALVRSPGLSHQDAMDRTDVWLKLLDLPHAMSQSRMVSYLWELLNWNEESLVDDWAYAHHSGAQPHPPHPAGPYHIVGDDSVSIAPDAKIGAGAVLDASKGPVVIDQAVSVGPNAVLTGPCYIGPGTQVEPLAIIRPGTSVGPHCRVGGELANSIMTGYSNKTHEGFIGDSYLGEWVNLGAGTTVSNRKNTYGEISVRMGGRSIPTGRRIVGAMIGDHSKTAIGTRLMAGSYIGCCCSVAISGLPPRFVPSFTFLTDQGAQKYDPVKAMEVMKTVFCRRNRQWTDADGDMAQYAAQTAAAVEGT